MRWPVRSVGSVGGGVEEIADDSGAVTGPVLGRVGAALQCGQVIW